MSKNHCVAAPSQHRATTLAEAVRAGVPDPRLYRRPGQTSNRITFSGNPGDSQLRHTPTSFKTRRMTPQRACARRHAHPKPVGPLATPTLINTAPSNPAPFRPSSRRPRPPLDAAPPLRAVLASSPGGLASAASALPPGRGVAVRAAKLPRPRSTRARAERRGCVAATWPRRRGAACAAAGTAGLATFLSRRCRPYSWTRSTWVRASRLDQRPTEGRGKWGGDHVTTQSGLAGLAGLGHRAWAVPASEGC